MRITNETTVTINYKLSRQNGEVLEETEKGDPLIYFHGLEMLLPELEKELEGKIPGDKIHLELKAEDAFGTRREELIAKLPASNFEEASELEKGQEIVLDNGKEEAIMLVTDITEDFITVDGNHPYADMDVIFDVEILEVHKTTDEDLNNFEHGHDGDCCCEECNDH
ncbi:MAG: FKBP-type peptidyl-prolyl cis-trans isomerase [Spirochaetales bacterium]|nr:FKBP-type peptidyl-prolyl cis-trans isomerase [Spirochaetales bacterium]